MGAIRATRVGPQLALLLSAFLPGGSLAAPLTKPESPLVVWADQDDDDLDGTPDGEQLVLPPLARVDAVSIPTSLVGMVATPTQGAERLRWIDGGRPRAWGERLTATAKLQGLSPGTVTLAVTNGATTREVTVFVYGVTLLAASGAEVVMGREHLSLERTPPAPVEGAADAPFDDADAVRAILEVPAGAPKPVLAVESLAESGARLDALSDLTTRPRACLHNETHLTCFASPPLRLVTDEIDRNHPFAERRSLVSALGGAVVFRVQGRKVQADRILGPRATSVGPIGRFRVRVRPFVVRITRGGFPAIGGTDSGAVLVLRNEFVAAGGAWGQCGVSFGDASLLDVKVVDPPPPHLLSLGDELALPASGGDIRLKIDGKPLRVALRAGEMPSAAAYDVAKAIQKLGFVPVVSPNVRVAEGAFASVDVSARHADGTLATFDSESPKAKLSSDEALTVRIGELDLADGLDHFVDADAMSGTLEERTLLKALDDGHPETIEVVIVPLFAGGGRIGESFIASDMSSLRNVVILDRSGIRARVSSLTLAHELGHVLLDQPGHPDDYGVDTPTLLMDSDAADTSAFGPRRLTLDECARAIRQSGPRARLPLLEPWPITAMKFD